MTKKRTIGPAVVFGEMAAVEIKAREEAMYNWLKEPVNKTNPQWHGVARYWGRLMKIIVNEPINKQQ